MRKFILILYVSFIVISGCTTTGGSIGGLFPAPKFTEGKIENNVYTAKDNMFSIAVPHKEKSYEYKYMQVKEQYKKNGAYVSFGPAAFNKSIYRVNIILHPKEGAYTPPISKIGSQVIDNYKSQMEQQYGTKPIVLKSKTIKIKGKIAKYWKLTQDIPAGKAYSNKSVVFNHFIYVIDYKIATGIIWVRVPTDTGIREAGILPSKFVKSLNIMPNNSLHPTQKPRG